jgi:tetrahydrodipicolinate N-acetyltransferase
MRRLHNGFLRHYRRGVSVPKMTKMPRLKRMASANATTGEKRMNTADPPAAAYAYCVGVSAHKIMKVIKAPHLAVALFNAQLRMRRRASVPLSVRLTGKVRIRGDGRLVLGKGITLIGDVVPIEFVSHWGACITIGDHTFINYGSSISAHKRVAIGRHCLLGHYTLILDNNEHDLQQHRMLPPPDPVVIEDHVWIGSHVCILPGVRVGHHSAVVLVALLQRIYLPIVWR